MTEAEWLSCTDLMPMLELLRGRASDRKLRLFAAACCRRIWHRVPDLRSRQAIEISECFIEGEASVEELEGVRRDAEAAQTNARQHSRCDAGEYAVIALASAPEWRPDSWPCVYSVADRAASAAARFAELAGKNRKARKLNWVRGMRDEQAVQCILLRDIFGYPLRPARPIGSTMLAWNERTVVRLAQRIYVERPLPDGTLDTTRLAILADALEEAGCPNEEVLSHCRSSNNHVRGCWVIDQILGKD